MSAKKTLAERVVEFIASHAKAFLAFLGIFLSALLMEWQGGNDALTAHDIVYALGYALLGGGVVGGVTNARYD